MWNVFDDPLILLTVIDCGDAPIFPDVTVQVTSTVFKGSVEYICPLGYSGNGKLTCSADGSWTGQAPYCISKCPFIML